MRRMGLARWVAFVLVALALVVVDGSSTADARPGQEMTCDDMVAAGFPQTDVDDCRERERREECEEANEGLPPDQQQDCDDPPARDPCEQFSDHPDVLDLCEAFDDFFVFPDAALDYCVDLDTFEIAGRCQVPDWQFTPVVNAFHYDDDFACNDGQVGRGSGNSGTRADAWYDLDDLNDGFPRVYERICLEGPDPGEWTPEHVAAIGVIMTIEKHRSSDHDDKEESVCHSWDPDNVANIGRAQFDGGLIRVPLNTICDTLYDQGWPAYPARDEVVVHPGCAGLRDGPDPAGTDGRGNDPGARFDKDLLPDGCWGRYPATNYDIGYQAPGLGDLNLAAWMWGNATAFTYNLGKGVVTLALWLVDWAFIGFDIRDYDDPIGGSGAQRFADRLIYHPSFPFIPLAWLVLFGWAGYTALRRRLGMAGSEILMSIVLVGLSAVLLDNQQDYMDSTWGLMDRASTALLAAGQGEDPLDYEEPENADPETARRYRRQLVNDLNGGIFEAFVELPYDHLNWGESLSGTCAERRNWIVARGPWGTKERPRHAMREADGCEGLIAFNEEPNGERLLGAVLVMFASLVLAVLLALVALTVVVGKLLAVLVFALAPFAALAAILPGYGRRLAWSWVTALIQVVIAVVGMSFLLSFLLLVTDGLLESTEGVNLMERFFVLNIMVFIVFFARKRLLANSQSFAGRLGDYWSATRGSGAVWAGAGPGAGIDLDAADRTAKVGAVTAGVAAVIPAALAGRSVATRWRERRLIGRQYRNLQRVSRWKYGQFGVP